MPRGYTQVPSPPKLRRRDTGEVYEWVCLGMWFLLGLTIIYLLDFAKIPGTPALNPDNRLYGIVFIGSLFCLDTLALMRFDYLAKSRVKEDYDLKMKEYKKLRDIYIENQSNLLKMQQETYASTQNVVQIPAPPSAEEVESSEEQQSGQGQVALNVRRHFVYQLSDDQLIQTNFTVMFFSAFTSTIFCLLIPALFFLTIPLLLIFIGGVTFGKIKFLSDNELDKLKSTTTEKSTMEQFFTEEE